MGASYGTSFGVAPGYPDYGPTGTSKFIPVKWSTKLVEKFYDASVLTHISNTNYEGEIKGMGSVVEIRTRGTVPVYLNRYQKGMKLWPSDDVESPSIELYIDQNTVFRFGIDEIDKYQSDINLMSEWAEDATNNEKVAIDTDVLAYLCGTTPYSTSQIDSYNCGATAGKVSQMYNLGTSGAPVQITSSNILAYFAIIKAVLREYNIPDDGSLFFVIPEVMGALLNMSDIKDASMTGDASSTLRSGRIGRILNVTTYGCNHLPMGSGSAGTDPTTGKACWYCLFGHPLGLTFADQFTRLQYIDNPEETFGNYIKSLHVYGRKVIKSSALGVVYAQPMLNI